MNAPDPTVHLPASSVAITSPGLRRPPARRRPRAGFALVVALLIISLLVVVAVSFLSSSASERQTSDAYTAKARAEQAAQAAVDAATAMLSQSFRDFPDSATVWDPNQSYNTGTPNGKESATTVVSPANEGTTLYLRAVPGNATVSGTPVTVADSKYTGTTAAANDPNGNNPNNPACKTFILPLISGVYGGYAQLASEVRAAGAAGRPLLPAFNLGELDPSKQTDPTKTYCTDLNVRRFQGDLQGAIGSPPDWAAGTTPPKGPKPARALWVNLKGSDGLVTGRYAFWMEDESFRANANYAGQSTARFDNYADGNSLKDTSTTPAQARSILPSDTILSGALAGFDGSSDTDAARIINVRALYPGGVFPEPLAILHSAESPTGGPVFSANTVPDALRYLSTTKSSSLNLSRHGTQRLNLNATTTIDAKNPVTMPEIRKLVEALRFHLPNWGQRFYRTKSPDNLTGPDKAKSINNTSDVLAQNAEIYLYKTAANLRDYVDADDQPTMIVRPQTGQNKPSLAPAVPPNHAFGGDDQGGDGPNYVWAQGKDGAPFLQEAMVRYRPAIQNSGENYTLTVDYYLEFWNMSSHDVTAAQLGHNPFVRVSSQQPWYSAYIQSTTANGVTKPLPNASPKQMDKLVDPVTGFGPGLEADGTGKPSPRDYSIDLINGVYRGDSPDTLVSQTTGVVFKAGTATVITTDPDFVPRSPNPAPVTSSRYVYGGQTLSSQGIYLPNTYYCSVLTSSPPNNQRVFSGATRLPYMAGNLRGIMPHFRGLQNSGSTYLDYEVEINFGNGLGSIDSALGSVCCSSGSGDGGTGSTNGYDFTWTPAGTETHNDYLHGGTLGGNGNTPSEMGDPRTNNEQLTITQFGSSSFPAQPDQNRYGAPGKSDAPPFTLGTPNSKYLKPASGTYPWSDYYDWPDAAYPTTTTITAKYAPSVIANSPLTSIGQLGDLFDPSRVIGTVGNYSFNNSRGGGRTLKIGQRDDRLMTYDAFGNAVPNNTVDNLPASKNWASWRLTDIFGITDPLELPARININGVSRDGGAALRAALTGFKFQPTTTTDPLVHGAPSAATAVSTASVELKTLPTDTTGVSKLLSYINTRLNAPPTYNANGANTPWGPFFERGELGELEVNGTALFGKNTTSPFSKSTDLAGVDLNHTFDRGREELFRRMSELVCTRGDTFTVYTVGQSLLQTDAKKPFKVTGTHRMRVTFRLIPKQVDVRTGLASNFHPGYTVDNAGAYTPTAMADPDANIDDFNKRFVKPDRYDVQVLQVNTF